VQFFPANAYLLEHISFFLVVVMAARSEWVIKLLDQMAKRVFVVAIPATCTLFPLALQSEGRISMRRNMGIRGICILEFNFRGGDEHDSDLVLPQYH
jgi:hypothetical protein